MSLLWMSLWVTVLVAGGLGLALTIQGARFERRVEREARELFARSGEAPEGGAREALPAPVRRYLEVAGATRHPPIRSLRLRHGGTFRPGESWFPIRGEQYFTAGPPGFVWWGRVPIAPGIWIDARDRAVAGEGNMLVLAASTWTLADARGPELDQGALTRLLAELAWLPTALLDPRHVGWTAVDEASATATLRVGGREVKGTFHFSADGLPARFTAERHRDVGGRGVLTPFVGEYGDYREVDGLLLPFRMDASWIIDGRPHPYVRFEVDTIELDRASPF